MRARLLLAVMTLAWVSAAETPAALTVQYTYTADSGLEPHQAPDSLWISSGLGTAELRGEPAVLHTADVTPQGDGRFYFLPLRGRQVGPRSHVVLDLRLRVLSGSGSPAATCAQMCVEDRRFGLGSEPGADGPADDRVLLLDFGAGGGGRRLGELALPLDITRSYTIELTRGAEPAADVLSLRTDGVAPVEVPFASLEHSTANAYYGLLFGHPVGGGLGEAEWERIALTCDAPAQPVGPRTLGPERQLLVDDWLVESLRGVTRVQGSPEKCPGNPVLVRDRPWEAARTELYGSVFYDPRLRKLRLYYSAMHRPYEMRQAYAESADFGMTWRKPALGIAEFEGADTNIVYPGRYVPHGPSVFLDPHDPDPARRYKLFTADYPIPLDAPRDKGEPGIDVAFSADGLHWTPFEGNPVLPGFISDTGQCAFWDPRLQRYVAYVRMWSGERCVGRTESTDFEHWTAPALVYSPEAGDRRQGWQFYSMSVTPYQGMYVGLVWIFPAVAASGDWQADTPVTWPELVVSRDSHEWTRVAPGEPFLPLGPAGSFDHRQIRLASSMVELPESVLLLYSGSPDPHVKEHKYDIGLASLRLDGFAAMHAGEREGRLTTRPLVWSGEALLVNARTGAEGFVAAEVLGKDGRPLPGYSRRESRRFTGDSLNAPLTWDGRKSLPCPGPEGLRLRFVLRDADLYSFAVGRE